MIGIERVEFSERIFPKRDKNRLESRAKFNTYSSVIAKYTDGKFSFNVLFDNFLQVVLTLDQTIQISRPKNKLSRFK